MLKKEYSTLLTGRNLTFEVFPLSFEEFLLFKDIKIEKDSIKKNIILENKDIIDRYNLNSQKAKDLALFFTTNFTGLVSLRNVRNSLKLSYDTVKDYLSYYKEAFLFFTLEHFSYSFKEQKTLASKIYCVDNGLRNAVSFKFSKDEGKLVENLVFVELKRKQNDVYYWKNKGEVDFILKTKSQSLAAMNVSYTDEIDDREIKSLKEFKRQFKKTKGLILLTRDTEKKENGVIFIPLWKWLLAER